MYFKSKNKALHTKEKDRQSIIEKNNKEKIKNKGRKKYSKKKKSEKRNSMNDVSAKKSS